MASFKNKRILITGGKGFLGTHVVKKLIEYGVSKKNIFALSSKDADLRNFLNCKKVTINQDIVIHLAGRVGGIGLHEKMPGEMFYDNILMGVHMLEAARQAGVKKFISIGTVCAYPDITPIPFREEDLWSGYPEKTNAPYALAKKMLLVQGDAYRKQFGFNSIHLIPVNLYGPGDDFDPKKSHVMPALIRKIVEAKRDHKPFIEVWGTGKASREFLYVDDAAEGIVLATLKYNKPDPINLGSGMEIKIKDLASIISEIIGYKGRIKWDRSRPDGQPRRCMDISKAKKEFGFKAKVDFRKGIRETVEWYLKQPQYV